MKTQSIIVIVTKNGVKYQLGLDKKVNEVLNEIAACKSDFYVVADTCAIKVDEITSVEQFDVPVEVEEDGE